MSLVYTELILFIIVITTGSAGDLLDTKIYTFKSVKLLEVYIEFIEVI